MVNEMFNMYKYTIKNIFPIFDFCVLNKGIKKIELITSKETDKAIGFDITTNDERSLYIINDVDYDYTRHDKYSSSPILIKSKLFTSYYRVTNEIYLDKKYYEYINEDVANGKDKELFISKILERQPCLKNKEITLIDDCLSSGCIERYKYHIKMLNKINQAISEGFVYKLLTEKRYLTVPYKEGILVGDYLLPINFALFIDNDCEDARLKLTKYEKQALKKKSCKLKINMKKPDCIGAYVFEIVKEGE